MSKIPPAAWQDPESFGHETDHRAHDEHGDHDHGADCGHEAVEHEDHTDYVHEGHRHFSHDGHWDEH
jgi:hypothetical protein